MGRVSPSQQTTGITTQGMIQIKHNESVNLHYNKEIFRLRDVQILNPLISDTKCELETVQAQLEDVAIQVGSSEL